MIVSLALELLVDQLIIFVTVYFVAMIIAYSLLELLSRALTTFGA